MEADNGIFEYHYDSLGRLIAAIHNQDIKSYRYDELGNRVKVGVGQHYDHLQYTNHTYNERNQLIKTQEGEEITEYQYDMRGNLIQIKQNGQIKNSYTFDVTNMMTKAFAYGHGQAEYIYDGFRNRVKKLETLPDENILMPNDPMPELSREVRYILDMTKPYDNLIMTQGNNGQGLDNQSFIWGNGLISGQDRIKIYDHTKMTNFPDSDSFNFNQRTQKTVYYLQDHLGSPIRLLGQHQSDNNFASDTPLAYDEFGVPVVDPTNTTNPKNFNNPFGFTGYQTDDIAGMYFVQARYYMPQAGRFTALDTHWYPGNMIYGDYAGANPVPDIYAIGQSKNLYAHCMSNPVMYIDGSGYTAVSPELCYQTYISPYVDAFNHANQYLNRLGGAIINSLEFEGSYGVGLGVKAKLGPVQAGAEGVLKQTHSYAMSEGEYLQRTHFNIGGNVDLWKDKLGARAGYSYGWTYSSIDGYLNDGKPSSEWMVAGYAGDASLGWGDDGERNSDWKVGFGAGEYLIIGWDAEVNFNITEFRRQMNKCE